MLPLLGIELNENAVNAMTALIVNSLTAIVYAYMICQLFHTVLNMIIIAGKVQIFSNDTYALLFNAYFAIMALSVMISTGKILAATLGLFFDANHNYTRTRTLEEEDTTTTTTADKTSPSSTFTVIMANANGTYVIHRQDEKVESTGSNNGDQKEAIPGKQEESPPPPSSHSSSSTNGVSAASVQGPTPEEEDETNMDLSAKAKDGTPLASCTQSEDVGDKTKTKNTAPPPQPTTPESR